MSFNVEITFTGLCIFVPSSVTGPVRMCVVLPDARSERQYALDGSWLKPHTGFVSFNLGDLQGGSLLPSRGSVYVLLEGYRLTLDVRGGRDEYEVDLSSVPDLDVITGGYGALRSSALTANPSDVVGQVLVTRGIIRAGDPLHGWAIPQTLGGPMPQLRGLSHEVILTLREVDSFRILARRFGTADPEPWSFSVNPQQTLRIKVGNLCGVTPCRCTEPRQFNIPDPDEDFKWHYQLLRERGLLQGRLLRAFPLPIPMPEGGPPAGQGINCIPAVAAAADINTFLDQTAAADNEDAAERTGQPITEGESPED